MRNKKIIFILLLLITLSCLTGCGTDRSKSSNTESIESSSLYEETQNDADSLSEDTSIMDSTDSEDSGYEDIIHTYIEGIYTMDGSKILSVYPEKAINAHISLHWTQDKDEFGVWEAEGICRLLSDFEIESLMDYRLGTISNLSETTLNQMESALEEEIINAYGESEAEDIRISEGKSIQILIPADVYNTLYPMKTAYAIKIDQNWYLYPFSVNVSN